MSTRQKSLSTFGIEPEDTHPDAGGLFEFDEYGPTSRRPIPQEERDMVVVDQFGHAIDRRKLPDSGLSVSDITDWPSHGVEYRERNAAKDAELHEEIMSELHDTTDSTDSKRLVSLLERVHDRETDEYTPGQGTALDTVSATCRKAEARPISKWKTNEIEAHLYDLGHLFDEMEIRCETPGRNCKDLAKKADALHQDLIEELQERGHFNPDDRQRLTNVFGSICQQIQYARDTGYCAATYLEIIDDMTGVSDRIEHLFSDNVSVEESDDSPEPVATDGGVAANHVEHITELSAGDTFMLDGRREEFTVMKPKYEPTGHSKVGVMALDDDLNVYEIRIVDVGEKFLDVRPDDDNSPVRMVPDEHKRVQDFAVTGHDMTRLEQWQQQRYGDA